MVNINQFTIQLPQTHYPVYIGNGLLANSELLRQQVRANQALVVTNDTIAPLYLDRVCQALAAVQCDTLILPDGEQHKDQASLFKIYDALIRDHHHRDTTIFALGGGVIGDMAGFAAATYQRGVRVVQLPTTLLSQVDSAIGGKTGINTLHAKNIIGSFHQPHAVIVDLQTLTTLPEREFNAGLGEVIKYALLVGEPFLHQLKQMLEQAWSTLSLQTMITTCCKIKASIVEEDEREQGRRVLLNLGHTFAHALETVTHYQRWLHGEAVAIGLYCAAKLSMQCGYLSQKDVDFVDTLLELAKLPRRIPDDIDFESLYEVMLRDKKVKHNKLPFVLIKRFGDCYLEPSISRQQLDLTSLIA